MGIVQKAYKKIFWIVFVIVFIAVIFVVGKAIFNSFSPAEKISETINDKSASESEPLKFYLQNRKCSNDVCEYGEDSKNCPGDCPKAELKREAWVQVNGPNGGYITELKKVDNTLFAATAYNQGQGGNGIYKISTDGLTWEALGGTTKATFQMSVNPNDKENIAFVSEGELYITSDGGKTWQEKNSPGGAYYAIAFSKANSSLLFASTNDEDANDKKISQFYFSLDRGESWTKTSALPDTEWSVRPIWAGISDDSNNFVKVITPHPTDENIIFVGTYSALFKSKDRGKTWKRADEGFHRTDIMGIEFNPQNPDEIYVRVGLFEEFVCMNQSLIESKETEKEKCAGVYKSTDGGESWQQLDAYYFDPSEGGIFLDDHNPNTAYAIFSRKILKTEDGGKTWKEFFWTHDEPFIPNVGIERLVVGKNSEEIFIAGRQGMWHSEDAGEHWNEHNKGLVGSEVVDIIKASDGTLYAGTYSLGTLKSTDGGQSWTFASYDLESPYVMLMAAHPADEKTIFLTTNGGIYASYDGALTWKRVGREFFGTSEFFQASHFHGLAFDPKNPKQIYIGGGGDQYTPKGAGIIISSDGGKTWRESNDGFTTDVHVSKIVVDKKNPAIVYATTQGATTFQEKTGSGSGIFKSIDYGDSWKGINNGLGTAETNTLAIDPNNSDVLYLGTDDDGVYKSSNGGNYWEKINISVPGLPETYGVGDIVINSKNNKIYVATVDYFRLFFARGLVGDYGIYVSEDGGKTWKSFSDGLKHNGVYALEFDEDKGIMYAGTRGGGVYWRDVNAP